MFFIKRTAIFSLLLITSCAAFTDFIFPNFPESNQLINRFPGNKKGIVILNLSSKYPSTTWCKTSLIQELAQDDCFKIDSVDYYQILMLEPGWYEIRGFEKITRKYGQNAINPKFSNASGKRISKPELAFRVKEGRISFVGQIDYRSSQIAKKTSQDQDFQKIANSFKNNDEKKIHEIFKGQKFESETLLKLFDEKIYIKDLIKNKNDFRKIKKGEIKSKL